MKFEVLLLAVCLPVLSAGQRIIKGAVNMDHQWSNRIYISPVGSLDFSQRYTDTIELHQNGSFLYQVPGSLQHYSLFSLRVVPVGAGQNFMNEGVHENILFLTIDALDTVEIRAEASRFCYSATVAGTDGNSKLFQLRDLKVPLIRKQQLIEERIKRHPDSAELIKQQAYSDWMENVQHYRQKLKQTILMEDAPGAVMYGLYLYYMASFGKYDSAFFYQSIQRIRRPDDPFVQKMAEDLKSIRATRMGKRLPQVLLEDIRGGRKTISSFKADYYIIDFWASWCTPCRYAIKNRLPGIFKKLKGNKILIGISVDENIHDWKKAVNVDRPSWPQLRDFGKSSLHEYFEIYSYPTILVLDRNVQIIFESASDYELEMFLNGLDHK